TSCPQRSRPPISSTGSTRSFARSSDCRHLTSCSPRRSRMSGTLPVRALHAHSSPSTRRSFARRRVHWRTADGSARMTGCRRYASGRFGSSRSVSALPAFASTWTRSLRRRRRCPARRTSGVVLSRATTSNRPRARSLAATSPGRSSARRSPPRSSTPWLQSRASIALDRLAEGAWPRRPTGRALPITAGSVLPAHTDRLGPSQLRKQLTPALYVRLQSRARLFGQVAERRVLEDSQVALDRGEELLLEADRTLDKGEVVGWPFE